MTTKSAQAVLSRLFLPCLSSACLLLAPGGAQGQGAVLRAPITLQGTGPYYRLTLPTAIYGRAAFDDLRDVRVRNAAGRPVPYAWLDRASDSSAPQPSSRQAPLFPVPAPAALGVGSAGAGDTPIGIKLRADGTLALAPIRSQTSALASSQAVEWLIDASKVAGDIIQANFEIAPDAQGIFPFILEASDDLRQWRRSGTEDQLVRLQQGGQTIERLAVELDPLHARFLRLRWLDPARAPLLTGVRLDSVQAAAVAPPALEWSADVRPSSCGADYCDYPAPHGLPIESLRIALTEPNTLAPIRVSSLPPPASPSTSDSAPGRPLPRSALYVLRHGQHGRYAESANSSTREIPLLETVLYRLTQPSGEVRSQALSMDGESHTTLRIRTTGPITALGAAPPLLSFGARPRALVFLAQGSAPFQLSWNASGEAVAGDQAGPLPLQALMPNRRADQPFAADGASVTLPSLALATPSAPALDAPEAPPPRKPWLWAALGGGLLLLGGMAWSLLASLRTARTEDHGTKPPG